MVDNPYYEEVNDSFLKDYATESRYKLENLNFQTNKKAKTIFFSVAAANLLVFIFLMMITSWWKGLIVGLIFTFFVIPVYLLSFSYREIYLSLKGIVIITYPLGKFMKGSRMIYSLEQFLENTNIIPATILKFMKPIKLARKWVTLKKSSYQRLDEGRMDIKFEFLGIESDLAREKSGEISESRESYEIVGTKEELDFIENSISPPPTELHDRRRFG